MHDPDEFVGSASSLPISEDRKLEAYATDPLGVSWVSARLLRTSLLSFNSTLLALNGWHDRQADSDSLNIATESSRKATGQVTGVNEMFRNHERGRSSNSSDDSLLCFEAIAARSSSPS